jgi:hypothetical protein
MKAKEKAFTGLFLGLALLVPGSVDLFARFHALAVRGLEFF